MSRSSFAARRGHWLGLAVALMFCLLASVVAAQSAPRWAHPSSSTPRSSGGFQSSSSFFIAVPLWQDVPRDVVRPGASLEGRFGWNLGWIQPELELGFAWVPIDLGKVPQAPVTGRNPLRRMFFGLGVRIQPPLAGKVLPYLSAAFDFNWWNFLETSYGCGWWYCTSFARFRFTPGFSGRVGLTIRPQPFYGIDLGLGIGMSFVGDFFTRNEWWLSPYAGFTFFM